MHINRCTFWNINAKVVMSFSRVRDLKLFDTTIHNVFGAMIFDAGIETTVKIRRCNVSNLGLLRIVGFQHAEVSRNLVDHSTLDWCGTGTGDIFLSQCLFKDHKALLSITMADQVIMKGIVCDHTSNCLVVSSAKFVFVTSSV